MSSKPESKDVATVDTKPGADGSVATSSTSAPQCQPAAGASAQPAAAAGGSPATSFEDFDLDDVEVVESKVFA